jgi:hypothetical protein
MGGVRAPVWVALATSAALLGAALWRAPAREEVDAGAPPVGTARRLAPPDPSAPVRSAVPGGPSPVTPGTADPRLPAPVGAEPPAPPAPPRARSGELASLEREAAGLAVARELVTPEELEAGLAELTRAPGETLEAFERRVEEERERLESEAFLLHYRLAALFRSTRYPQGFDVIGQVVDMERRSIEALPAEVRTQEIRNALESWEPERAHPVFDAAPDPALAWGNPPDL